MTTLEPAELTDRDFDTLRRLVYEQAGIRLGSHKRSLVRARLAPRLRYLRMGSFREYCRLVTDDDAGGTERLRMLDCICTNVTCFFREPRHFEFLRKHVFEKWSKEPVIRILSAACSSGQEPYSIAITALEHFGREAGAKVEIHAGDLSFRMLERAKEGVYPEPDPQSLPDQLLRAYFLKGTGRNAGTCKVAPEVRHLVRLQRLNLKEPLRFEDPFHAVFCRNVLMYFDRPAQRLVLDELARLLVPGGILFLGHAESMLNGHSAFQYLQPAVHERK